MLNKKLLLSLVFCFFFSSNLNAQIFQNKHGDWLVYTTMQNGKKLCYMISYPKSKKGNYSYRSRPYAMVTNINGKFKDFSVTSGYKYRKNYKPIVDIDNKKYKMSLVEKEIAWFKTQRYNKTAIDRMKKGRWMKVRGRSIKGTYSIDRYSLKGFTKAYRKINSLCSTI